MIRLGLFGGTFDPVHYGHLRTLDAARIELDLTKVQLLPNPNPPHKSVADLTPYHHRKEMLRLALIEFPHLEISSIEEHADGPAYTTDTVQRVLSSLTEKDTEVWLIIGADSLLDLPRWKDPEDLFRNVRVAVLPRPGFDLNLVNKSYLSRVRILHTPILEIAARDIRHCLAAGESVDQLLPTSVQRYILEQHLYEY
jgi:nicotinate-nucleotide adenylyltransferase